MVERSKKRVNEHNIYTLVKQSIAYPYVELRNDQVSTPAAINLSVIAI